jgi:hypothetical protein
MDMQGDSIMWLYTLPNCLHFEETEGLWQSKSVLQLAAADLGFSADIRNRNIFTLSRDGSIGRPPYCFSEHACAHACALDWVET